MRGGITYVVTRHSPELFGVVHVYLGQVFTILLVVLACILWLRWVNKDSLPYPVNRAAGFLARLFLISGYMFLFWLEVHHWYIWFLDRFLLFGFSFFGYHLFFAPKAAVYYETFSFVTFVSLILATRSVPWARKGKILAMGLSLLFLLHLFHRTNNALMSAFHYTSLLKLDLFLCDIGQYLLPVLLWLVMVLRILPRKNEPANSSRPSPPHQQARKGPAAS